MRTVGVIIGLVMVSPAIWFAVRASLHIRHVARENARLTRAYEQSKASAAATGSMPPFPPNRLSVG